MTQKWFLMISDGPCSGSWRLLQESARSSTASVKFDAEIPTGAHAILNGG